MSSFASIFTSMFSSDSFSSFAAMFSAMAANLQKFWLLYIIIGTIFLVMLFSESKTAKVLLSILAFPVTLSGGIFNRIELFLAIWLEIMMFKIFDTNAFFVFFVVILASWLYRLPFGQINIKVKKDK